MRYVSGCSDLSTSLLYADDNESCIDILYWFNPSHCATHCLFLITHCESNLSRYSTLKWSAGKGNSKDQYQSYCTYTDGDMPGEGKSKEKTLGIPLPVS